LTKNDIEKTKREIWLCQSNISRIENKIVFAKEEKKNLQAQVNALEKTLIYNQTPGTQFALFNIKEKLENKNKEIEDLYLETTSLRTQKENLNLKIKSLENAIKDLSLAIAGLKSSLKELEEKSTKVVKPPVIPKNPIKTNKKLNITIAAVLGIFLGIFVVFFQEFLDKNKEKFIT